MSKTIVVIGSEGTGKSTLARQLAEYFKAPLLEEFSRQYATRKSGELSYDDVMPIAIGQSDAESEFLNLKDEIKVMDTCILSTIIYSEMYYQKVPPKLEMMFDQHRYDHFLLCYPDPVWKDDGIRKMPMSRMEMHKMFENDLIKRNLPCTLIRGTQNQRLPLVLRTISQS